nr:phospho-N-acetylmuramoyl-pentapeptide-transferase [uncultured Dethiosulfovibrio sp.]
MMAILSLFLLFFCLSFISQSWWIDWLRSRRVRQVQKSYGPQRMPSKGRTPALGGVVFMAMSLPGAFLCWVLGSEALTFYAVLWALPFFSGLIGLLDDLLKLLRGSSEGLKSLEKLILQVLVALFWSLFALRTGHLGLSPHLNLSPFWTVVTTSFIIVSMLNAVNVTDGLDGLAAGTSSLSLVALAFLVSRGLDVISVGLGISVAFLWHNAYPARVFMGDCGSHFLGGLLVAIAACGGGVLYVVPVGALFGLEILSVAIQIVSIRCFGKKFFLMSPVHHHFELLGWSEVQIVLRFWLIHLLGIVSMLWLGSFVPSIF